MLHVCCTTTILELHIVPHTFSTPVSHNAVDFPEMIGDYSICARCQHFLRRTDFQW